MFLNKFYRLAVLLGVLFCARYGFLIGIAASSAQAQPPLGPVLLSQELLEDEKNTIEVFQRVSPAVVFISTATLERNLFTFDVNLVPQGSGSGFIWDANGFIVTNNHVIENARKIQVTLGDKTIVDAKVVGRDASVDIAVLRIRPKGGRPLPFVNLGDSSRLQVGQKVLAIGNPFGLDRTLTTGVLSALGREIESQNRRKIRDVIQTDASINPGNSGGPLLDSKGRVIGINTMIYSPSGASAGIGFAVPINTVKRVVPQIIKFGRIIRPSLGIGTINDHIAQRNGIEGVIVGEVYPGRAAFRAGLKPVSLRRDGGVLLGDVIVGLGQFKVTDTDSLMNALEQHKPGDRVSVTIMRDEKKITLYVTLDASQPDDSSNSVDFE